MGRVEVKAEGTFDSEQGLAVPTHDLNRKRPISFEKKTGEERPLFFNRVEQFREMLRIDMTRQQLMSSVIGSDFVLENEGQATALLELQQRDIRYIDLKVTDFNDDIIIEEQQVTDYYDLNNAQFKTPEQLSLQYVELKVSDLMSQVTISDEAVKAAYTANIKQYQTVARRKLSHILIESTNDDALISNFRFHLKSGTR